MRNDLDRVREHLVDIHRFFTDWVSGACPEDDATFRKGLLDRLSRNAMVIMPGGMAFEAEVFTKYMRGIHGSNPKFRIDIRNVNVRHRVGDVLVATYEEWQRDARDSMPPNNGRISTMVIADRGGRFEVLHVHETWLPAEVMVAGPYDF